MTTPEIKPSNILFVSVEPKLSPFEGPVLISTAADRSLRLYSALPPHTLLRSFTNPSDSAVLSVAVVDSKWLLVSTMNGRIDLLSADTGQSVSSIKPHQKYATRVLYHEPYVISAAYDKTIYMHTLTHDSETGHPVFSEEQVGKIDLPTPPEALALVDLPEGRGKAIVFSRRDSTSLFYNLLTPGLPVHSSRNLAPESTSWVSYHAMNISVHPTNPGLLAVATSTVPHMKFLLVEVDKEGVVKEMFTGAPQSPYSTGICVWRPDGSGVWLNADEGVVRGLEVKRGKVAARLQACAGGEKVRSLWAGEVEGLGEVLVTGGFDRGLRVWSVKGEKEVVDDADVGEER